MTSAEDLAALAERVGEHATRLDGVVHSIGFAPQACSAGEFLEGPWPDVATALEVSAYSLKALAVAARPLMARGSSVVGLTFDASVAWPVYDWMGVAKAALESTARYLARDLGPDGIRVNLVAAGPIRTTAATSIPGFEQIEGDWDRRAPLGWDVARRRARRPAPSWPCCPTGSRRPPRRSCTSTAACTRWAGDLRPAQPLGHHGPIVHGLTVRYHRPTVA